MYSKFILMEPKFKVDDTVHLKSGSVDMTIDTVNKQKGSEEFDGSYVCVWFIGGLAYFNTYTENELVLSNHIPA